MRRIEAKCQAYASWSRSRCWPDRRCGWVARGEFKAAKQGCQPRETAGARKPA